MAQAWLISDIHIGHKNILKYRPQFSSLEEHDDLILTNILTKVKKRDTLWLLGDCFFDLESMHFLRTVNKHVGYVNWIIGNHDTDNTARQKVLRLILMEGLVHKAGSMFKHAGFWLTHYPIHPLELRNLYNIHGHVHSATIPDNRYFNACCENLGYSPIKLMTLKEIFKGTHDWKNFRNLD